MGKGLSQLVFQPPDTNCPRFAQQIELTTERGERIAALYIRNRAAHFTLLFSHGNAEDLSCIKDQLEGISRNLQVNVLLYDYSGYGRSTGTASENNIYADITAAFNYLRYRLQTPWQQIVLYGRSLGTAPSTFLASRTPVRGVILQSPMLSIYRVPFKLRFTLPGDLLCNIDRVSKMQCPVLIMHGMCDELVPWWHGYKLYEVRRRKRLDCEAFIVPHADHNHFEMQAGDDYLGQRAGWAAYLHRLQSFLVRLQESPESDELRMQPELLADPPEVRHAARSPHAQGAMRDAQMAL